MKREKLLTLVVVALLLLNVGTLGYLVWQHQRPPRGPIGHQADQLIIEGLQLTPPQVQEFEQLKLEHRNQMQQRDEWQRRALHDYWNLLKSDAPDTVQAQLLNKRWVELEQQKKQLTFEHFRKIRLLCTPEQKPLFDSLIGEIGKALMPPPPQHPPRP